MSPTVSTFALELVNFLVLAGALTLLLFKPVRAALDQRIAGRKQEEEALAARVADANRLSHELAARQQSYETEVAALREERLSAAEREAAATLARAHDAAAAEQEALRQRLHRIEQAESDRLAAGIASAAGLCIERLLAYIDGPALDSALVEAGCRELRQMSAASLGSVVIESARPLSAHALEMLKAAIATRADSVQEEVSSELVTGIRITTAAGMVDASAAGFARHAVHALKTGVTPKETEHEPVG
jgi:hypothetical protein